MIGNIRLNRRELTRRRSARLRMTILGVCVALGLVCGASLGFRALVPTYPAIGDDLNSLPNGEEAQGADPYLETSSPLQEDTVFPEENIEWVSFFVDANTRIPIHLRGSEGSDIIGSLDPGSVVYGYYVDEMWACVTDPGDNRYFVKGEYVTPFSKDRSEISLFRDDHVITDTGFTIHTSVNSVSGMTLDDVNYILHWYPDLKGMEEAVLLCEKKYGINAYFILGVASQESGYGRSSLAKQKNNFFGLGAYDENTYENGLDFASKAECVEYFCMLIAVYVDNGRVTPSSINQRYASDELWAFKVTSLMNRYANLVEGRETSEQHMLTVENELILDVDH